jgi:anti-anti-sigma factor
MADLNTEGQAGITVRTAHQDGAPVISVAGELDLTNAKEVRSAIEAVVSDHGQRVVFEVSDLTFMDSSGIALLASVTRQVREVELRDPTPIVRRLIEMTGLDKVLRMTP